MEEIKNTNKEANNTQNTKSKLAQSWPLVLLVIIASAMLLTRMYPCNLCQKGPKNETGSPLTEEKILIDENLLNIVNANALTLKDFYGADAVDFTFRDVRGKKATIRANKGKEIMIIFWATWCPPCRAEIADLIELRAEKNPEELEMIAISFEKTDIVSDFTEERGLNYKVVALPEKNIPLPYSKVRTYPTIIFIGKDGKFKAALEGGIDRETMEKILSI